LYTTEIDGVFATDGQIAPYVSSAVGHWLNQTVGAILDPIQQEGNQFHHQLSERSLSDECHRSDLMVIKGRCTIKIKS
jgi:hypothetical protein